METGIGIIDGPHSCGWIKIHRKVQGNPLWKSKPFSKGQAWIDLLLKTNHKAGSRLLLGNRTLTLQTGQVLTSQKRLSEEWGWSRRKVSNFFQTLFENGQIGTPESTPHYTLVTVANWASYQGRDNEEHTERNISGTSLAHQKHTFKKEKNYKNGENLKSCSSTPEVVTDSTKVPTTIVAASKPQQQPKAPPDPRVKTFVDYYHQEFLRMFGKKPVIAAHHPGLVKKLLAGREIEEVKTTLARFFESGDPFIVRAGYGLNIFYSQYNKLLSEDPAMSKLSEAGRQTVKNAQRWLKNMEDQDGK